MSSDAADRRFVRVDFSFTLAGGWTRPEPLSKAWFFEVPAAHDTDDGWAELLNRIFYDRNVSLRRAEPNDANWLQLVDFKATPADVAAMLASQGKSWAAMPWFDAEKKVAFERSACYLVEDAGRYDVLTAADYMELILMRSLDAATVDEKQFVAFFDHVRVLNGRPPDAGQAVFDDRKNRFANLTVIRENGLYNKPPGERPWACGPVDPSLIPQ